MRFMIGNFRGEIYSKLGLSLSVSRWSDDNANINIHLIWPEIYISIPPKWFKGEEYSSQDIRYGFTFFERQVHIHAGERTKVINLPWSWEIVRHDLLFANGSLYHRNDFSTSPEHRKYMFQIIHEQGIPALKALGVIEQYPYKYTLRNGDVQRTIATVYGEEREWRWKWFKWLPLIKRVQRTISVDFKNEIGEGVDTWKGGTLGCGWEWPKSLTMHEALLDMEKNRKFER